MFKKIIIFIIYFSAFSVNAEIYKWVDGQGNTHYGDKPVTNATEMEVDVTKKGNIKINDKRESKRKKLLNTYDEDRKRENKEKAKKQKQRKKLASSCARSKDTLRSYIRARSLYNLDKAGNRVTVSNIEREKRTAVLQAKINKYCK